MTDNKQRERKINGWMVATVVLGALVAVGVIVIVALMGNVVRGSQTITYEAMKENEKNTEEILANDLEIEYEGDFIMVKDSESGMLDTGQQILVTNKGDKTYSYNIHFEATSEDGSERYAEDYVAIESLKAGQSQYTQIFTMMDEAEAEKLKGAKFGIVEVAEY